LAGLLAVGFICNLLIRPVPQSKYMTAAQLAELDRTSEAGAPGALATGASAMAIPAWLVFAAWLPVLIPLAWGIWVTLQKAAVIFSQG
ncbi:MAG TPA: hypothetical protein VLX90_09680, partial [Steroidobacteraceae bacterium]|nr:hypothetical protein [Steroidobacteraceae bacterium]